MSLRPSIEDLRKLGHHATNYNWGIQFISIPSMITGFSSSDLNARCTSAGIPKRSINAMEVNLRGHKAFQHGIVSYGNTWSTTLYETVDSKVGNFCDAYMDMQWLPIAGTQVPKSLNQCAFILSLLDSYDKRRRFYTIIGAWMQDYNPGSLASDSGSVQTYEITWQFDYYL